MANLVASSYKTKSNYTLDRVSLGDSDNTIEGADVVFVQDTALTGERTVTVRNYDRARYGEYGPGVNKPVIIIKNAVAANVNNLVIKDVAGNTLYTFSADNSVTPAYIALRLKDDLTWELA